jgi:hypothetical protein
MRESGNFSNMYKVQGAWYLLFPVIPCMGKTDTLFVYKSVLS